jgi:hypothetical protein
MRTPAEPRWGFWHSILGGLTAADWRRLLRENRFAIDPVYWHRAGFLTLVSLINSRLRRRQEDLYGPAIEAARITESPLFILGHWRSGTTHLHNLLAQDTEQFAFPNSFQVCHPHTFLYTEEEVKRRFGGVLPRNRPQDNVEIRLDTPQEDEFALLLTTLRSPYLGMFVFPRHEERYAGYLTFRSVPKWEIQEWKRAFLRFLQQVTLKHGRALVLKSPTHTARVRLLLELFPNARFVHIHRHPHAVFQSSRRLFESLPPMHLLQRLDTRTLDDGILRRCTQMYDAFFEDRALIPAGQFHEVRFEDLEADPVGQMRSLYEGLGLSGFERLKPKLEQYVSSLSSYKKNRFGELEPSLRGKIRTAWERSFDAWGYCDNEEKKVCERDRP